MVSNKVFFRGLIMITGGILGFEVFFNHLLNN